MKTSTEGKKEKREWMRLREWRKTKKVREGKEDEKRRHPTSNR